MLHVTTLLPPEHWLAIQITHFNRIDERDEGFLSAAGLPNYGIKKAQDCVRINICTQSFIDFPFKRIAIKDGSIKMQNHQEKKA